MSKRDLSPSALNKLMDDPRAYKKRYITFDEDKQRPSEVITLGSLIHTHLASEDPKKSFKEIDWDLPSEKIQGIIWAYYHNTYAKVVSEQSAFDLTFKEDGSNGSMKLLELCKAFEFNQHLKTDKGRLEHFSKNNADLYFNHLKMYKGKVSLITTDESNLAKTIDKQIKANKRACEIINFGQSSFEIKLRCDYNDWFGLQGILDNHWVSEDRNHLYINDFKTTEMTLDDFANKKLRSRYDKDIHNQMAQYDYLLEQIIGPEEYKDIQVHRHVIYMSQKNGDVYPFEISDETFGFWKKDWRYDLKKAAWHFENESFDLPHDYQNNLVRI